MADIKVFERLDIMEMGGGGFGLGRMGGMRGNLTDDEKKNMPKLTKEMLKRIFSYLKPYTFQFSVVFLTLIIIALLGLVPPMLVKLIIDKGLNAKPINITYLATLIGLSFGATVTLNLIGVLENYINTWISQHIIFDMKNQMYQHIQNMSHRFFSTQRQGDVITRMTSDIDGIQSVINGTIANLISSTIILTTTIAALFYLNWKLAILGIIIVPLFIIPTKKVGKTRWQITLKAQEKRDKSNQILNETLSISGSLLVKLFSKEKQEYDKFKEVNKETTDLQIREQITGRWFRMVMNTFTTIGPMLIYLVGGILISMNDFSVTTGTIITVVALLNRLYGPVSQLLNIQVDLIRSMALFQRIFDYFDLKNEVKEIENAKSFQNIKGDIEFRNVCFEYDEGQKILKNINFKVNSGQSYAIVGPSGSGKSTITNLIPRLYDVCGGSILIDGEDIREMKLDDLRSAMGIVTQDTYLFNDTVKENLLYANNNATIDEIINACKASNIHDFIISLPNGYDTLVGNRGVKLSGGEKQRVSIARTILKNPKILILDEATSSLDSISENAIQNAIMPLLKGRTSIVIAHRLSTIMACDQILVLKNGEIVEVGTHNTLVKQNGTYKKLYETQFKKVLDRSTRDGRLCKNKNANIKFPT